MQKERFWTAESGVTTKMWPINNPSKLFGGQRGSTARKGTYLTCSGQPRFELWPPHISPLRTTRSNTEWGAWSTCEHCQVWTTQDAPNKLG